MDARLRTLARGRVDKKTSHKGRTGVRTDIIYQFDDGKIIHRRIDNDKGFIKNWMIYETRYASKDGHGKKGICKNTIRRIFVDDDARQTFLNLVGDITFSESEKNDIFEKLKDHQYNYVAIECFVNQLNNLIIGFLPFEKSGYFSEIVASYESKVDILNKAFTILYRIGIGKGIIGVPPPKLPTWDTDQAYLWQVNDINRKEVREKAIEAALAIEQVMQPMQTVIDAYKSVRLPKHRPLDIEKDFVTAIGELYCDILGPPSSTPSGPFYSIVQTTMTLLEKRRNPKEPRTISPPKKAIRETAKRCKPDA